MDINYLLLWLVCFSCLTLLFQIARSSIKNNWALIIKCGLILIITFIVFHINSNLSGYIGSIFWLIFLVLPKIIYSYTNQLIYQQYYRKARKITTFLWWLYSIDSWRKQTQLLLALELAQRGKIDEATTILKRYETASTSLGRQAKTLLFWLKADWEECLLWFKKSVSVKILLNELNLLIYYIRALGETGDLNSLLKSIEFAERSLGGDRIKLNLVRMFALAFCGQTTEVKQLFDGVLSVYPQNMQTFWLATAQMAAGNKRIALKQLLNLRLNNDWILSNSIDWRLCYSLEETQKVLNPASKQILNHIKTSINQEYKYNNLINFKTKKAYLTYGLIGLNFLMFALETKTGGSENLKTLYALGALEPQAVFSGQWWRLLNANFLHFGWIHLLTNMLGLYFLGRFVELTLGVVRYLIAYLLSGIGAMLLFSVLTLKLGYPAQILVGASAAIMGLIGVISAILVRDWYQEKSRIAAQRLQMILLIVGLQFVFDWTTPQVSFLSHVLGLLVGFLIGNILLIF